MTDEKEFTPEKRDEERQQRIEQLESQVEKIKRQKELREVISDARDTMQARREEVGYERGDDGKPVYVHDDEYVEAEKTRQEAVYELNTMNDEEKIGQLDAQVVSLQDRIEELKEQQDE